MLGKQHTFGVSGRLYKSNVLLYDHQTESLWSQLQEKAISGPLVGHKLKKLVSTRTSWKAWKRRYEDTLVLSTDTGHNRDYSLDPYERYYRIGSIWFPVGDVHKDLSPKEMVLGIEMNGESKACSLSLLRKRSGILKDQLAGRSVEIEVSVDGEVVAVRDHRGEEISSIYAYWFAWQAFHPETIVYKIDE